MSAIHRLQFTTLDVFSQERYAGNQLAVVHVSPTTSLTQEQKQAIAKEFNYAVTAFLFDPNPDTEAKAEWRINIFLTSTEISFAGQPVIGLACLLGRTMIPSTAGDTTALCKGTLITKSGRIEFTYDPTSRFAAISIPHDILIHPVSFTPDLALQHGVPSEVVEGMKRADAKGPIVSLVKGSTFCLVELDGLDNLGCVQAGLKEIDVPGMDERWKGRVGVLFFVRMGRGDGGKVKVRTRMVIESFEDSATGAAAAALAVCLFLKGEDTGDGDGDGNGQDDPFCVELEQGIEMGRASFILVDVWGDRESGKVGRVVSKGSAVQVMEGSLLVPAQ